MDLSCPIQKVTILGFNRILLQSPSYRVPQLLPNLPSLPSICLLYIAAMPYLCILHSPLCVDKPPASVPETWARFIKSVCKRDYAVGWLLLAAVGQSSKILSRLMYAISTVYGPRFRKVGKST